MKQEKEKKLCILGLDNDLCWSDTNSCDWPIGVVFHAKTVHVEEL